MKTARFFQSRRRFAALAGAMALAITGAAQAGGYFEQNWRWSFNEPQDMARNVTGPVGGGGAGSSYRTVERSEPQDMARNITWRHERTRVTTGGSAGAERPVRLFEPQDMARGRYRDWW